MRGPANANAVVVEIKGFEAPPLKILKSIISDKPFIAPPIVEVIDPVVILRKHVNEVLSLGRAIMFA